MADKITVKPSPIQRNRLDVAMELTQLYYSVHTATTPEAVSEVFAKFYAIAAVCDSKDPDELVDLVDKDLMGKIKTIPYDMTF